MFRYLGHLTIDMQHYSICCYILPAGRACETCHPWNILLSKVRFVLSFVILRKLLKCGFSNLHLGIETSTRDGEKWWNMSHACSASNGYAILCQLMYKRVKFVLWCQHGHFIILSSSWLAADIYDSGTELWVVRYLYPWH